MLARISSINDRGYGVSSREIEPRFYDHGGYAQRYLNEQDVKDSFGLIGKCTFRETAMTRRDSYYSRPKNIMRFALRKHTTERCPPPQNNSSGSPGSVSQS